MPNFSSLARQEVPEKFLWVVGVGVCKVIFMSNPTFVLRLGWGFDKIKMRESWSQFLFNKFMDNSNSTSVGPSKC